MKKTKYFVCFTTGIILLLFHFSCVNQQTKNIDGQVEITNESVDISTADSDSVLYLLPSPGEILLRFYTSDISYKPELLNSPGNKNKYIDSKAQSLNLGIYITDMAYSAMFERTTETYNYLEAIQSLSNETGISSGIFESLLTRSKANAGKIDSLLAISNEAYTNMVDFLETGGKENAIAQVSAGAYIESLYIGLQSINKYSDDNESLKLLMEMKYPVENLIEKAKKAEASDEDKSLLNYLEQIFTIFLTLDTKTSETIVSENKSGTITIGGGEEVVFNEAGFNNLKDKVTEIRNIIIGF